VAAVEFKTKTSADENSRELATRDSIGAVCRCVSDVPEDGRNVGNDPASEAGERRPLWPVCCGSVKAALVVIQTADHRAQLAQHCAVLGVTRASYVVSDGVQIIRVVCVSFAKQFLTIYTRLVTSSLLAAMPWVTGSPDQIPDLPLDAVGILEDSDHLRERAALVRAVLQHSQSHGGDPVVPLYMIRPELIAYLNRVGKTGTDQMSQYLASIRVNDAQWPVASRILFRHVQMLLFDAYLARRTLLMDKLLSEDDSIVSLHRLRTLAGKDAGSVREFISITTTEHFQGRNAGRVGDMRDEWDDGGTPGAADDGGSSDAGIPGATGTDRGALHRGHSIKRFYRGGGRTTGEHAANNNVIRRAGKVEVITNGVREQQSHRLLKLAYGRRPYCALCRVPKHAVTKAGAKRHSGYLHGPGLSVRAVGVCCLCPGEVPLCSECFPIWNAARKLHFHESRVHTPNSTAATDPAPLPAPRNRKRTHAEQQQPSSARDVAADHSRSSQKSVVAGLDAQGGGVTAAAVDGERPLKKRRLLPAGDAAPCCVGGDAAACARLGTSAAHHCRNPACRRPVHNLCVQRLGAGRPWYDDGMFVCSETCAATTGAEG
jgi:hypothetical protein